MERLKHIIDSRHFSREWMDQLFQRTDEMIQLGKKGLKGYQPLSGIQMASLFVGESLRTRARFAIALQWLGGDLVFDTEAAKKFSSMAKGESLEDTIEVLNEYEVDLIVLRHDEEGGAERAAAVSKASVINAGDGPGQHPTQMLLDLHAIKKYRGQIDGTSVALIGDVEGSRTIHSLAYGLGKYKSMKVFFVSPKDRRIKPGIKEYLERHNVEIVEHTDIREVAPLVDVFYQTRTQTNLGTKAWDRKDESNGFTIINKEVLDLAKQDSIILHPLPCLDEIVRSEVDNDPRAVYLKSRDGRISQVKGGLYVTMALLEDIFAVSS